MEFRENPDLVQGEQLKREIKEAMKRGWDPRTAAGLSAQVDAEMELFKKKQEMEVSIANKWGSPVARLSQEEADYQWEQIRDGLKKPETGPGAAGAIPGAALVSPPNYEDLVVDTVLKGGRFPTAVKNDIEGVVSRGNTQGMREMANVVRRIQTENALVVTELSEATRAILGQIHGDMTDEEIGAIVRRVAEPKPEEVGYREKVVNSASVQKAMVNRFREAMRSPGDFERVTGLRADRYYPGFAPAEGDPMAAEMEEAYARKVSEKRIWYGAAPDEAEQQAMAEVLAEYGPFWDGSETRWMQHAPVNYIPDAEWLAQTLDEWLQAPGREYRLPAKTPAEKKMADLTFPHMGLAPAMPETNRLKATRVRLKVKEGTERQEFPQYYVEVWGEDGWERLRDTRKDSPTLNQPVLWGGFDVYREWSAYNTRKGLAEQVEMWGEEQKAIQQDKQGDSWSRYYLQ